MLNADLRPLARLPLLFLGMLSLLVGVLAGLARFGVALPLPVASQAGAHGALMIAAFFGTVISLERAVALARGWAYLAPLAAGLGGLSLLLGTPLLLSQLLLGSAAAIMSLGSLLIARRQPALFTVTLALGALAWLAGNLFWLVDGVISSAVPWWMIFLVITIAGERLELTRFLPTPLLAKRLFAAIIVALLGGAALATQQALGLQVLAGGLLALALWLLRYDIARRTIHQEGLTRFIAVCLLSGYAWLAWGAWLGLGGGFTPGDAQRDAALHSILLGFVLSMVFGHAPIIFPAVAKVRIPYHPFFYLPLLLLYLSLLLRVATDASAWRQAAGIGNALALLLLVLTMLVSVARGRRDTPL